MGAPVQEHVRAALPRRLGFWHAIGLVVGITIGSGIFRSPGVVASRVPDPMLMLAVWLAGGLISLCGALSVAELAATFPQTGGWYAYLREGWGRLAGFLFGWSELLLIRASATGAVATVFSEYLLRTIGVTPVSGSLTINLVAAAAIAVTAVLNIRGVRIGAAIAGLSSVAKYSGLAIVVLLAALLTPEHAIDATASTAGATIDPRLFGLALISALYAYDGFADVSFSGGEVANGSRTLPRAIVIGTNAISVTHAARTAIHHGARGSSSGSAPSAGSSAARSMIEEGAMHGGSRSSRPTGRPRGGSPSAATGSE